LEVNKGFHIIELPKILDDRGTLTFLQSHDQVPFEVKRVFWTYDVPGGQVRGGHAYRKNEEVIIALSGSFDVVIDDNGKEQRFTLNRSYMGLYVPAMTWRHLENFSTNAITLTLASEHYMADDYIRPHNRNEVKITSN